MTYCLGIIVNDGLVFAGDSRTSAGVDSVATFRKVFVYEEPGERVIVILTAGNLAVTQEVISMIERGLDTDNPERSLFRAESMLFAARIVGYFSRTIFDRDAAYFRAHNTDFNSSFLVGGQIKGERPRMFLVYPAGNFIEAAADTPYFQLGETKYGKPILERVLTNQTCLLDVAKCALVSFDSTIKANISVAPPIDVVICQTGACRVAAHIRVRENDPYFIDLRQHWGEGLRRVFAEAPKPPWHLDAASGEQVGRPPRVLRA